MSSTFLHRFFDLAKSKGKPNAFHFYLNQEYHFIPRWLLRFKIKHFSMGILELGGKSDQFFYMFSHHHPEWVYASLGALTAGLQLITFPPDPSPQLVQEWTDRYPPSFVYYGLGIPSEYRTMISRNKKSVQWIGEWDHPFRKVFNLGIIHEKKRYLSYRKARDALTPETVISPVRVIRDKHWEPQPLTFSHIEKLEDSLAPQLPSKKLQFIMAQPQLSFTLDQLLTLFWPLATHRESVLVDPEDSNPQAFKHWNPSLAVVPVGQLDHWSSLKGFPWNKPKGLWKKVRQRKHLKKILGKRIQKLWVSAPLPPELEEAWQTLPIQIKSEPVGPNFPL